MAFWRLKHNPANGDVAIYSVPTRGSLDNAPLTDPANNMARLQFHSGLIFPSTTVALTQQKSVTIPAQTAGFQKQFSGTVTLFAHGKGEPCMVEGYIVSLGGVRVDLNGSVPVFVDTGGYGFATWVVLCSDATNVILRYWGMLREAESRSALSFDVVASAFDFLSTGPAPTGDPLLPRMKMNATRVIFGRGRFDSLRRYIRKVAAGADKPLATGPTVSIVGNAGVTRAQDSVGWRWRYSCAGYVKQTTKAWNGTATNGGTADAPYISVKF